jgi:tetrahydromethanopterin S-methyltransferase subunit G
MVMQEPFGWHVIDNIKFEEIRRRLSELEKLTWGEILIQQKHWNHTVQTEKLCKQAKDQLIEMRMDDLDEIVSLRLSNLERVWGVRLEGAMTLLWWDPDHSVWPTQPRH